MKRVIFILLICALLVHLHVWALEDVTVIKEDVTALIKKLEDPNESIRQEVKEQLLDIIWQKNVRPYYPDASEPSEGADILLSDIDGNGTREIIALISIWGKEPGYIAVVDEMLSTIQVIEVVGGRPVVKITDLLGEGKKALIIESDGGRGTGIGSREIEIYQWAQGNFTKNIWQGIIMQYDFATSIYSYSFRAKVQIVDLDQDGIREIVRIGEISGGKCEEQPEGEQETGRARVEIEMGEEISEPEIETGAGLRDLSKVISGYQAVYKIKETFFYDKEFNHYIQYKARVIQDTTATMYIYPHRKENETWVDSESISIAAGTRVGVLSDFPLFLYDEYFFVKPTPIYEIYVVLPDGRIGKVGKEILEKIESEDE